jgi:hypothetical protein
VMMVGPFALAETLSVNAEDEAKRPLRWNNSR